MFEPRTRADHKQWLKCTAVFIACFGPVLLLSTVDWAVEPARWSLSFLSQRAQTYNATTRFLSALTGGFLMGWGVTVWCLQAWVYDAAPEGVRRSVQVGALTWFVFDSAGSILSGNPINALMNIIALLLVVGPMWKPALEDSETRLPLLNDDAK